MPVHVNVVTRSRKEKHSPIRPSVPPFYPFHSLASFPGVLLFPDVFLFPPVPTFLFISLSAFPSLEPRPCLCLSTSKRLKLACPLCLAPDDSSRSIAPLCRRPFSLLVFFLSHLTQLSDYSFLCPLFHRFFAHLPSLFHFARFASLPPLRRDLLFLSERSNLSPSERSIPPLPFSLFLSISFSPVGGVSLARNARDPARNETF